MPMNPNSNIISFSSSPVNLLDATEAARYTAGEDMSEKNSNGEEDMLLSLLSPGDEAATV